jgi:phage N-6-adenine-methyltransferase
MNKRALLKPGASTEWETPQELFNFLNWLFDFTIDVCALPENAKCGRFYTPEDDGLSLPWDGSAWCNPPYGRGTQDWTAKAEAEFRRNPMCRKIVMLLPARTDTGWFHENVYNKARVVFLRGRLRFVGAKGPAPFPSMLAIWEKP